MFNKILLPLDRSSLAECVLPHAIAVAHAFECEVVLANVMDPPHQANWRRAVDPLNWQIRKAEAATYLGDRALVLQQAGLKTDCQVLEGPAAERIVEFSHKQGASLIILSSHGQSGLSRWNVSSVVHKVIERAGTSIMIVRAYESSPADAQGLHYRRILLPVDGSQRAESVLPLAATLARVHESEMLLAHVVKRPEMPRRTPPSHEDIELAEQVVERNRSEATQYLDQLQSRLAGTIHTRVIVSEHVATALHELVDQEKIDCVLLCAHGYSAETSWPYGSIVNSFIAYGTTPLLIAQDLPPDSIQPARAEMLVQAHGR